MRKHLKLITEDEKEEDLVGNVVFTESQSPTVEKNVERMQRMRNWETDETWGRWVVGMGYVDFEDEDDYDDRIGEAADRKLREIDERHLEKAGVDLDGD